jgi:hypothetical protein
MSVNSMICDNWLYTFAVAPFMILCGQEKALKHHLARASCGWGGFVAWVGRVKR